MTTIIQTPAQCATPADGIEAAVTAIVDAEPDAGSQRPFWQTEPCPAWCTNDHHDSDFFEDRDHWVNGAGIDLGLYRTEYGEGKIGPGELILSATQHYRDAEPEVGLTVPVTKPGTRHDTAGDQDLQMTVAEARQLRDALSELLAAIASPDLPVLTREPPLHSAELVVTVGHAGMDEVVLSSEVNHWTDRGEFEVCMDINGTPIGSTPAEAREYARKLREYADIITAHAVQAEALAKQAQR